MNDQKEAFLIRRIQRQGDRQAAEELVSAYYREIYAFAYRQTGDVDAAMDLTQEIFLAALQSIQRYDPKRAGFRTWLYRIASHKLTDLFRSPAYRLRQSTIPIEEVSLPTVPRRSNGWKRNSSGSFSCGSQICRTRSRAFCGCASTARPASVRSRRSWRCRRAPSKPNTIRRSVCCERRRTGNERNLSKRQTDPGVRS